MALKSATSILLSLLLLMAFSISANEQTDNAASEMVKREYPVPEHGMLELEMPRKWNVTYFEPGDKPYPIIIFYPEKEPAAFQLTMSILWYDGIERDVTNNEFIKNYVKSIGENILTYSDQEILELKSINGTAGSGYYFSLSDSSAPDDEYRYLTQGGIAVNEILLVFSCFTREQDDELQQTVLHLVETAKQNINRFTKNSDSNFLNFVVN